MKLTKFIKFILNFNLMIVLGTNKLIMRSKFLIMLFWISTSWSYLQLTNQSWDQNCLIMLLFEFWSHKKGLIRRSNHYYEFQPHEKWEKIWPHEFDLMKKTISISWNLTSWPWALLCISFQFYILWSVFPPHSSILSKK